MDDREKARDDEPQEKRLEDLDPSDEQSGDVKAGERLRESRVSKRNSPLR